MRMSVPHELADKHCASDHDDFGLSQSKIMNMIDPKDLVWDASGKPVPTLSSCRSSRIATLEVPRLIA